MQLTVRWDVVLMSVWLGCFANLAQAQDDPLEDFSLPEPSVTEEFPESLPEAQPAPSEPAPVSVASPTGIISVDFKDADIRQVLRIISLKSGVDIVAGPDVEALVTIKLTNVPWEQALDIIVRTYALTYERKGNVIRVMTLDAVEQEALATEVFPLSYSKAKEVSEVLKEMLSDRGKIKFDERTNTVIVTDLPATLFQLKQVVERLDQQTPQVYIESKIVETKLTKDDNLGINWFDSTTFTLTPASIPTTFPWPGGSSLGNVGEEFLPHPTTLSDTSGVITQGKIPQRGGTFTFGTLGPAAVTTTINFLKQRVDTNILSNPSIMTMNNKEAYVQVGDDINVPNYQIDPTTGRATVSGASVRSTGILLKVTPHVNPQQEILLDVKPEITEIGSSFDDFGNNVKFPRFTVQKAETQVRMGNNETLVIGGLVKRKKTVTDDKVPILGDLPIVGVLFTNHQNKTDPHQDLLIFITVTLVKESDDTARLAKQLNP